VTSTGTGPPDAATLYAYSRLQPDTAAHVRGSFPMLLLAVYDAVDDGTAYRAELSVRVDQPVLSDDPILQHDPPLPGFWWTDLTRTLEKVVAVSTDRVGSPVGLAAEATVCAQLLQTVARGDNLTLAEPLRDWSEELRRR
jgi:hypothetical protein